MEIKINKEPNKTQYVVGQDFDKKGMSIIGVYKDGSEIEILDYKIENGINLKKEQTSITISYLGKTVTQKISVVEKSIINISIKDKPNKIKYIQNKENLELKGGSLNILYNDDSSEIINMDSDLVKVFGFDNTKIGKNIVTLSYLITIVEL